jgi:hypothetical protein
MKYAAEMDSGAVIYILSCINISTGFQKLIGGGVHSHTDSTVIS